MINLTKQERVVLIFLGFAILSGIALNICFKNPPRSNSSYSDIIKSNKSNFKVNINAADKNDLIAIKGIGPTLARRIINHRTFYGPFSKVDDVIYVKGIGNSTFQRIKDFITID